ncbi:uncharacterized protein LOC132758078 isoform X2 [Ruditapes philippinarum]|uniref:uncharacterized protein LOC132758078 isoform X2 n=1 Tax=Ruditapes philippinarum TaxID=129788 RepID=UPI00295AC2D2|nr:uncharacterized protein LOC132758078 isoform X2 [Ruditapes philippinarum]
MLSWCGLLDHAWINRFILSLVILEACQNKQQCHLVASTKTFQQDPCPGTRKYLKVAYKCKPSEFSSETVCEGDQLELRCSRSTRIAISSGLFGRTLQGDTKCPELLRNTSALKSSCQSKVVIDELLRQCHGRKRCTLEAEEYIFGNPCPPGVNKYLNIVYTCVPKRVLISVRRHNHRKHDKHKSDDEKGSKTKDIPSSHVHNISSHHTTLTPEKPSADFPDTAQQHPSDPVIGQSKDSQDSKGKFRYDTKLGKDTYLESGNTTPCMNQSHGHNGPSATGLLSDWLNAFNFIKENREKAVLYLVLGVAFGIISILFLVIIRLAIVNKRKSKAKLDISEPAHIDHPPPSNHIEAPTLERTDSVDRIEVVRFNPMRSRDFATCTLRSDIGNRSLTNYYG